MIDLFSYTTSLYTSSFFTRTGTIYFVSRKLFKSLKTTLPGTHSSNSETINDTHDKLEEECKKEDHEVHGTIISEGFVTGSEPAHVRCGGEQKPVNQR